MKRRSNKLALLRSYLRAQRNKMATNLYRRIVTVSGWTISFGIIYYYGSLVKSEYHEINKMRNKLRRTYPEISEIQIEQSGRQLFIVTPKTAQQLTNLISKCWNCHFKVCVSGSTHDRNLHIASQDHPSKTLYISLQNLNKFELDEINQQVEVGVGLTCQQLNSKLSNLGYNPLFFPQLNNQSIHKVIENNLPVYWGTLSQKTIKMDVISAKGDNFESASQASVAGKVPNINSLFIGTGGILGVPTSIKLKITPQIPQTSQNIEVSKISLNDVNQSILKLRQLFKDSSQQEIKKIKITFNNKQPLHLTLQSTNCEYSLPKQGGQFTNDEPYDAIFSINQSIFEKILLNPHLPSFNFQYNQGIIRLRASSNSLMQALVLSITLQNGVFVWHKDATFLNAIKPAIECNQVCAELMRELVMIQKGLDHRGVLECHSRYGRYFKKSRFRQVTELFW